MHKDLVTVLTALVNEMKWYSVGEIIYVDGVLIIRISIGSKTGTGDLFYDEELQSVVLKTRYNQEDLISIDTPIDDIAWVAWRWCERYLSRDYGYSDAWINKWLDMGIITKVTKSVIEYKIN
jgi:hypothetical protein